MMIRTISGIAQYILPEGIVVQAGGVGYLVTVPIRVTPRLGERVDLFTYHHIREDGQALFGFTTLEELNVFESLLTVPSIGPKLAMTILSAATPEEISSAVATDNVGFFKSLSGVGGKSAAKIIVELKGKLTGESFVGVPSADTSLLDALTALGYRPTDLQNILKSVPSDLDLAGQVNWSLKTLGSRN